MPKIPTTAKKTLWTNHAKEKMRYYRLSENRVKRILNAPKRIERGIAENTVAMMQRGGTSKKGHEIWVMIQDSAKQRKIISAWRYPGATKEGEPLPEEILKELNLKNII